MMRALMALLIVAAGALPGFAQEGPARVVRFDATSFAEVIDTAEELPELRGLVIAQDGEVIVREGRRGYRPDQPSNIKSLSKTLLSALVGIAIGRGLIAGPDEPIAARLRDDFPEAADPRLGRVTVGHLLSMRAGLASTSGEDYAAWATSPNWVRFALAQPFVADPGTTNTYSTGNSHLLSAILTRASGRSTFENARDWLARPLGMRLAPWERDPQGLYMGGNNMAVSADDLLAFGEMYRNGGVAKGRQVVPKAWVEASWTPRGPARHFGHAYGYGWFITRLGGEEVRYGWGYGGQMLYVVPRLRLTVVVISGTAERALDSGYIEQLHQLTTMIIGIAAATEAPKD
jgi:CubicO group peptidase (beta-lactamase class C family)